MSIISNFKNYKTDLFCKKLFNIKNFKINESGEVDVDLNSRSMDKIPVKFGRIDGNFDFGRNKITTLKNSPNYVREDFNISFNKLTTLVGGPTHVGKKYSCYFNNLKDVYGFPEIFHGELVMNSIMNTIPKTEDNPVCEIINLVSGWNTPKQIIFIHWLNTYKVIRNGDTIIQDRIVEALSAVGINDYVINNNYRIKIEDISNGRYNLEFKNYKVI